MLFALKKNVSVFLQPSSLILLCLGAGLFFLVGKKRPGLSVFLLVCGLFTGLVSFLPAVPDALLHELEEKYDPYSQAGRPAFRWILVLGQGVREGDVPETSRVNGTMYARLMEATRIARPLNPVRIVVSISGDVSAECKTAWWSSFCSNTLTRPQQSVVLTAARDTEEEIRAALHYIGSDPFILVTSASHMPRAMLIAGTLGGKAVAAPCDFEGYAVRPVYKNLIPSSLHLCRMEKALHEYAGLLWFRLTNAAQINAAKSRN